MSKGPGLASPGVVLEARPAEIDLGGRVVRTWAYGDTVPGPVLRGRVGDTLAVRVDNRLPEDTTVHWHGLAVPNAMDGVPDLTQAPIGPGHSGTYRFRLPHPGTYWYHPHVGVQPDRGLYGALLVDDPAEPGRYDLELLVVLDDWLDGTGRTPDDVMRDMRAGMGAMAGMASRPRSAVLGGEGGDVAYPHYLLNGRLPGAPASFHARPGQRARIRIVNAGADTAFRVALGGHRLTITPPTVSRCGPSPWTRWSSPWASATTWTCVSATAPSRWSRSPRASVAGPPARSCGPPAGPCLPKGSSRTSWTAGCCGWRTCARRRRSCCRPGRQSGRTTWSSRGT